MLFHTHILFGIIVFLLLRGSVLGNEYVLLALVILGAILPDIDEHNSKITQLSGLIGKIVSFFAKHRGIFHSLAFILLFSVFLGWLWKPYYAFAFFAGYLSHLFADALNPMGIPVFYPFSEFRLRGLIRVGGVLEWVILILLAGLIMLKLVF